MINKLKMIILLLSLKIYFYYELTNLMWNIVTELPITTTSSEIVQTTQLPVPIKLHPMNPELVEDTINYTLSIYKNTVSYKEAIIKNALDILNTIDLYLKQPFIKEDVLTVKDYSPFRYPDTLNDEILRALCNEKVIPRTVTDTAFLDHIARDYNEYEQLVQLFKHCSVSHVTVKEHI